jgi:hypothetical protein
MGARFGLDGWHVADRPEEAAGVMLARSARRATWAWLACIETRQVKAALPAVTVKTHRHEPRALRVHAGIGAGRRDGSHQLACANQAETCRTYFRNQNESPAGRGTACDPEIIAQL